MKRIIFTTLTGMLSLFFPATLLAAEPSLAEVGDLGKIVDSQGIVSVRSKMGSRWTAATKDFALKPGDWLRTDVRGANAMAFRFQDGGQVILGPGTLVEVIDSETIAFVRGEIEIDSAKKAEIKVQPAEGKGYHVRAGERKVLRRPDGRGFELLEKDPNWLLGFKGAITSESMGSLLAKVDGRNTPLTLGYHKVTVDIRDGIARTVIEESFVNHTTSRLEGTFYFPLPQDASISGFGMWIGSELVEADVVEKQRAREIFETILRERRDPGLLEWNGGNMFKARVFPIEAGSEKRIKITYTQVLPMRGGKLRYSYGLQSEMLQQNPLRELSINVKVSSELPIRSFTCATHDARVSKTKNSAQAEFVAQEYTPNRDFEVEIDIDAASSPVVMIPHQRSDDGYFIALITPPSGDGNWQREIIPESDPIHFVILADTSGSMNASARENQDALIASLVGSLGEKDSFDFATCDTVVRWLDAKDGTREQQMNAARDFFAARNSLGWTDLDLVFEEALKRSTHPNTHVVYIGDGVITTGNADPVAFANRLKLSYAKTKSNATFHAIAPGSSYESGVLKAIASLGGGSVRKITGTDTPSSVARDLLTGIAQPGMSDVKIEFKGLRVARVYPEDLPNLPAGSQQVVIGRYLPEGANQTGEIIVTGKSKGRELRFRAPVTLKDAESGNSFIPRLWARNYLDVLLEQGRTQEIQDEIIALSEEYKIMTPYTSFLVLESDADRERFKVKKRFQMRDGERFFADGREKAEYELLKQQMLLAGTWRLNLQRGVLQEFNGLGRMPLEQIIALENSFGLGGGNISFQDLNGYPTGSSSLTLSGSRRNLEYERVDIVDYKSKEIGDWSGVRVEHAKPDALYSNFDPASGEKQISRFKLPQAQMDIDGLDDVLEEINGSLPYPIISEPMDFDETLRQVNAPSLSSGKVRAQNQYFAGGLVGVPGARDRGFGQGGKREFKKGKASDSAGGWYWRHYMGDLVSMFPGPISDGAKIPDREGKSHAWPAEALSLADSLLRFDHIVALHDGGIAISQKTKNYDVIRGSLVSETNVEALVSSDAWWARSKSDRQGGNVQWWQHKGTTGHYFDAMGLGRMRAADLKRDRFAFPLAFGDQSFTSIANAMATWNVVIEKRADDRVELVLTHPSRPKNINRYLIDTSKYVLLMMTQELDGKVTDSTAFSDFVEVAGCWWARSIEQKNADGKVIRQIQLSFVANNKKEFDAAMKKSLLAREDVIFINENLPAVNDAKQALADGKADFESHFALFNHFVDSQQWERSSEFFESMRKLQGNKRGMRYLDIRFNAMKRRNEEAREMVFETARGLVKKPSEHELYLIDYFNGELQRMSFVNERHDFLEMVKPIYYRAPKHLLVSKEWQQHMFISLQNMNRRPEAHEMLAKLVEEYPRDVSLQTQFANSLVNKGENEAAIALLNKHLANRGDWQPNEVNSLRTTLIYALENQSRTDEVLKVVTSWLKEDGIDEQASSWVRSRYLAVLIRTGENDKAYDLIEEWINDAVKLKGKSFDAVTKNKAMTAIETLCGSAHGVNRDDIPERFHQPMVELIKRFALDPEDYNFRLAEVPMQNHRFNRTETARSLRAHFAKELVNGAAKLELAELNRMYNWVHGNDPVVDKEIWQNIANTLIERWSAMEKRYERDQFATLIISLTSAQLGPDPYLTFLRRQLKDSGKDDRGHYTHQLFRTILSQSHTAELEEEAFTLLYQIENNPHMNPELREQTLVAERASALINLDDWILRSSYSVAWGKLEKKEELSRTELADKQNELIKSIQEKLSARLASEQQAERGKQLTDWLKIEQLYFDVTLKRDPAKIAAVCWGYLESHKLHGPSKEEGLPWQEAVLIERHLVTLEYLATQPNADPELAKRLLAWLERNVDVAPDPEPWKGHQYRLLVALNQPQALKKALMAWIKPGDANNEWRVTLGYLLAELNEIEEAVKIFEAVEQSDELTPLEYKTLADWYLVLDRKDARNKATLGYYMAMDEWQLSSLIENHTSQIANGFNNGTPEDFDPVVIDMFKVIFKKSQYPQNHLSHLGNLFRYTKDFRLLECVPEGIMGNSAQQIYPFISHMDHVLQYVSDEATTDQLLDHLKVVRKRAKTPIDQRGLDLLEMLVRRKASEVLNKPDQHVPLALAAMQRAFKQEWGSGERRLMSDFLARLGVITQKPLADEQVRELNELLLAEKKGTPDHLHIALHLAQTVRNYGGSGIGKSRDILDSAIQTYIDANGGALTSEALGAFDQLISYFEADNTFALGEKKIFAALNGKVNVMVSDWLVERKYSLYRSAISSKVGRVSLGQGIELYQNVTRLLIKELDTERHNHRYLLCNQLIQIYQAAHSSAQIAEAKNDIVVFAEGVFKDKIGFETQNYQSLVLNLAGSIRSIAAPLPALKFLIDSYEREPKSFLATGSGGWRQYGYYFAEYRAAAGDIGDLEPRLLKIVLAELRNDLEVQRSNHHHIYRINNTYFWKEKSADFQKLAEQIANERKDSIIAIKNVAEYLFHGLQVYQSGIDILVSAHKRGIQDEAGISQLAGYFEYRNLYGDAVPYLRELVKMNPSNVDYRRRLIRDLGLSKQRDESIAALDAAISYFKENKLWSENTISPLAQTSFEGQLWKHGVILFDELIALHQRNQPNRGIGNGTLSNYYTMLATCHSQLGNTSLAVEAAAGAIVSWGSAHNNRASALQSLKKVLTDAKDLENYVKELDKSVEESGLENPIVRKALGQIYSERKEYKLALHHLRLATESQPDDIETQQALISVYDALDDGEGAIKQLLESIALSPRNITLLQDLGARYERLKRDDEAERARTNLVEALPNESEGHAMLAEIRETQKRWDEAAKHWAMVAEIRALEPTGLQRLGKAQMELKQFDAAAVTFKKLLSKEWASRFGNVHSDARRNLEAVKR